MISLNRCKTNRAVLQKNTSSNSIIKSYLNAVKELKIGLDFETIKEKLKQNNIYRGRSAEGSISTMGVRMSQMCFYMFGYRVGNVFVPSPMTANLLGADKDISVAQNMLVSVFSMQFPHPYSRGTKSNFNLYFGRLVIKLLLDERINKRLYIDEVIWFLPFIESITSQKYEELISSIKEYRSFSYAKKIQLFKEIPEYEKFMATVLHEYKYYFLKIFKEFGVFNLVPDVNHNEGKIITFVHPGKSKTKRYDNIDIKGSRTKCPGYVEINQSIVKDAKILSESFSLFDEPTTMKCVNSYRDWLTVLYDTEPLDYLAKLSRSAFQEKNLFNVVQTMVHASKYGSRDGKDFENSLEPVIYLFRETRNVDIISGPDNTDLLCTMDDEKENIYKMNVDAKKRKNSLNDLNGRIFEKHLNKYGSIFCIIVAPRFNRNIEFYTEGYKIVTINAEVFGAYCYRECINSKDGMADFESLHKLISENLGKDITYQVRKLTEERYGIVLPD